MSTKFKKGDRVVVICDGFTYTKKGMKGVVLKDSDIRDSGVSVYWEDLGERITMYRGIVLEAVAESPLWKALE